MLLLPIFDHHLRIPPLPSPSFPRYCVVTETLLDHQAITTGSKSLSFLQLCQAVYRRPRRSCIQTAYLPSSYNAVAFPIESKLATFQTVLFSYLPFAFNTSSPTRC